MDVFDILTSTGDGRETIAGQVAAPRPSIAPGIEQRIAELEMRFNRLALVTHSLWDLLKDRHGYTEEELRDWVTLTDLKDGQLDGRVRLTRPPQNCLKCNRVVSRAFSRCMYCGEIALGGDAFDRVH